MQAFSYTASIKVTPGSIKEFRKEYPGITDVNLRSREFASYNECVNSCKVMMEDFKTHINTKTDIITYKVGSEINPNFSGNPTLSKDWEQSEVARLWIYDEKMEKGGQIQAIGQARIYSLERADDSNLPLLAN